MWDFSSQLTGNGIVYQFDPITGEPVNGGVTQLNYQIRQISVLQPGEDFLRGVILLDKNSQVHAIPASAAELVIWKERNILSTTTYSNLSISRERVPIFTRQTKRLVLSLAISLTKIPGYP